MCVCAIVEPGVVISSRRGAGDVVNWSKVTHFEFKVERPPHLVKRLGDVLGADRVKVDPAVSAAGGCRQGRARAAWVRRTVGAGAWVRCCAGLYGFSSFSCAHGVRALARVCVHACARTLVGELMHDGTSITGSSQALQSNHLKNQTRGRIDSSAGPQSLV